MANHKRELQKIGKDAYAAIVEMVEPLNRGSSTASDAITEDALSVEVRSDWHDPCAPRSDKPTEYCILLSTGGPAVRIIGRLDEHCEPETATLEVQDWFQPWTAYHKADEDVLLAYARCFYFGE